MNLLRDEHVTRIGDTEVAVVGTTGPVKSTWRVMVDGQVAGEAQILRGMHRFEIALPDGSRAEIDVKQSLVGSTTVTVQHDGEVVDSFSGFVA